MLVPMDAKAVNHYDPQSNPNSERFFGTKNPTSKRSMFVFCVFWISNLKFS